MVQLNTTKVARQVFKVQSKMLGVIVRAWHRMRLPPSQRRSSMLSGCRFVDISKESKK